MLHIMCRLDLMGAVSLVSKIICKSENFRVIWDIHLLRGLGQLPSISFE